MDADAGKAMNETDTPETDGEWNRLACLDHPEFERRLADFCRHLERERNEAVEVMRQLVTEQDRFGHGASMNHPRLTRAITAARKFLEKIGCGESSVR